MAIKATVRMGGAAGSATYDYTSALAVFDDDGKPLLDAGMQFGNGSACQYQLILDDDAGAIPNYGVKQIAAHNVVTVSENEPGYDAWLSRGRIGGTESYRGDIQYGNAVAWRVSVDDANSDLKGLTLTSDWVRTAETGYARVLALVAAFLNGSPRLTTVIQTHLVAATPAVPMPAKTYPAGTELPEILDDCAGVEGRTYGVVIHHQASASHLCLLYIDQQDYTTYVSTIDITDTNPNLTTEFPPVWDQGSAAVYEGQDVSSGIVSRYGEGDGKFVYVSDAADVAIYDYWVRPYQDSISATSTQATTRASAYRYTLSDERLTVSVSLKLPASKVDLLCAGMTIRIRSAAAMGGPYLGTYRTRRIAQIKWEPIAPQVGAAGGYYYAHLQLDRPLQVLAERQAKVGPKAPSGTTTNFICGIVRANLKSSGEASGAFMEKASDCNDATEWGTNGFPVAGQYWVADAGSSQTSERWRILNTTTASSAATAVTVYGTDDAAKFAAVTGVPGYDFTAAGWTIVASLTGLAAGNNSGTLSGTFRYWAFRATAGGANGWSVFEFELGLSGYTPASTDSATGSSGTTSSGLYAPADHDHGHGVIATGDLHTEYVREADPNYVDLTDGGATVLHSHAGSALDSLSDVTITAATEGDELRYRSGVWVNRPGIRHAHIVGEPFTGDGAATRFLLANEAASDELAAFVAGSRTDATLQRLNNEIVFVTAPANGAAVRVDYVAGVGAGVREAYRDSVLALGPVAYWRFGETTGTSAADSSGNAQTGTYTNGPVLGVLGALRADPNTAVTFDGVNDHVTVPDSAVLDVGNLMSIAVWIKRSALGTGNEVLVTKGTASYSLDLNDSFVRFVKPGTAVVVQSTTQILDTAWHFVVISHGAAGAVKLYIDNVDRSGAVNTVTLEANASAVGIGADPAAGALPFAGSIDEPAIFSRVLTAAEVAHLYTIGTT